MNRLGVVRRTMTALSDERAGFLRRRTRVDTIEYLDWTIDEKPLQFVAGIGDWPAEETTLLVARDDRYDAEPRADGLDALTALVGGTPMGDHPVTFDDGRVAILHCLSCRDLGCETLSAEVVTTADTVRWKQVGWQHENEPFAPDDCRVVGDWEFDRVEYEHLIGRLMSEPW